MIEVYAVRMSNVGSAVVLVAKVPSAIERGYFRDLVENAYTLPTNAPLGDHALSFLADVKKAIEAKW